jgi:hypothetical protein
MSKFGENVKEKAAFSKISKLPSFLLHSSKKNVNLTSYVSAVNNH